MHKLPEQWFIIARSSRPTGQLSSLCPGPALQAHWDYRLMLSSVTMHELRVVETEGDSPEVTEGPLSASWVQHSMASHGL